MFSATQPLNALPANAVEIRDLTKIYAGSGRRPAKTALRSVNLDIPRGSIFGLLGPNGAGKSTLINILAGLVLKTSGTARIWNYEVKEEPRRARSAIGVVPQELNLDAFFTPRELLELQAGLYGVPSKERQTDALLKAVSLSDRAHSYARSLSGGMRRRLMVAKAMVHNPPVLVLDEPTAGVDIELRQLMWAHVRQLNAAGTTVLLTTHYLEEAQELCDRIAIIKDGGIVANDTTQNLLARIEKKLVTVTLTTDCGQMPGALTRLGWEQKAPRTFTLTYKAGSVPLGDSLAAFQTAGLQILDLATKEADLEDIFLQLTSRDAS